MLFHMNIYYLYWTTIQKTGVFRWKYANKLRRDSPNIRDIAGTTIDYKGYSNIVI